ncbi:MAG: ABC transporter ATP-binding protein [Clostridia bacterium]|nr:ABC transporter ATP-binding protein [Clostridia bacterium]
MQKQITPALEVEALGHSFGKTRALDGLSFAVLPGQIVGLLGRNGAGKSTLLRIISGQLKAKEGDAWLFGQRIYNNTAALSSLCMIGDTPDFGKLKNLKQLLKVCDGLFPGWKRERALELIKLFELPVKRPLKGFSRGMQTAAMLTVGLASGALLTVFDEPSLGLDAVMRERFYDLLLEEKQKDPNRTFILSTHLIDEVARTLDSAVMVDHGRLLCQAQLAEFGRIYMSVSGAPDAVRQETDGMSILKEETVAGSLVRHLRLNSVSEGEKLKTEGKVQVAPMSLQRLFVFLAQTNASLDEEVDA